MHKEILREFTTGERLDKALATAYPQYSRSALEKLILSGDVKINGQTVKTKYKLKSGDLVEVDLSEFNRPTPKIDLPVIYEDENVVVVDKPAGVLTHAKGTLHNEATVATWLKAHVGVIPSETEGSAQISPHAQDDEFWNTNRAGIVHRLDRGTSGVIICAKNETAQIHLQKQFANRNVKKTYIAAINDTLPDPEGVIDVPIERNPKKPATFRPGQNGKPAQTEYKVLKSNNNNSLIELKPYTGRTHQLRVHLVFLNHPIVGDTLYGGSPHERLMLHAHQLEITLPNGNRKIFTSSIPNEFEALLA